MKDQVIVITGASRGIGAALARACAARGARLVLAGRDQAALDEVARATGGIAVVGDVTHREHHAELVVTARAHFGRIDAWVNNAGRGITRMPSELTDDDMDEMFGTNFKSVVYGMQAALPEMKARGAGVIVNVSTMLSKQAFFPLRSAYAAMKAGVNSITAQLREELKAAHPGIKLVVVYPGIVATEFGVHALHGGADSTKLPGAQPVDEVARVIADAIEHPEDEVMTRRG